jgi:hypothetical protein
MTVNNPKLYPIFGNDIATYMLVDRATGMLYCGTAKAIVIAYFDPNFDVKEFGTSVDVTVNGVLHKSFMSIVHTSYKVDTESEIDTNKEIENLMNQLWDKLVYGYDTVLYINVDNINHKTVMKKTVLKNIYGTN